MSKSITYEELIDQFGEDIFVLIEKFEEIIMNDSETDISELSAELQKIFNRYGRKIIEKFF
ncbi:hypothetical protein, partial [Halarsenatibacter silvermanii]